MFICEYMYYSTSVDGMPCRPAVYHADSCPLANQPDIAVDTDDLESDPEAPDILKDIPSGRTRQASICSCGADSLQGETFQCLDYFLKMFCFIESHLEKESKRNFVLE